jgi:hypothetical protein
MTSTVAFDMAMIHRAFRNELHNIPALIAAVRDGDVQRATVIDPRTCLDSWTYIWTTKNVTLFR